MGMMSPTMDGRHPVKKMSMLSIAIRIGVVSAALIVASGIAIDAIDTPGADGLALTLARIVSLLLIGASLPEYYDLAHLAI